MKGHVIAKAPTGAHCAVCAAQLGHLVGYVPATAMFTASLFASDYAGLNMGVEEDCPRIDLCLNCTGELLPNAPEVNP